jgi:TolB-like protein/Tfp pilus assembly protein PilF
LADSSTEGLTTDLAHMPDMRVTSGKTAVAYGNRFVDTKRIGRELGVRYTLEGSVQRSGSHVRVNAQLIDAATDAHLWAERFDSDTADLFALQNEITAQIGNTLNLELIDREAARPTERPDALDYIFRGSAALHKGPGRDSNGQAISLFERALALDPYSVYALTSVAGALANRVLNGVADSPAADLERAEGLIAQALAISPRYRLAHFNKAQWLKAQGRCEEAIPEYEMLIELNRNWVGALANLGQCKIRTGAFDEGIALEQQVIRLSPRDPFNGNRYDAIGWALLLQSRTDEAIVWLQKGRSLSPNQPLPYARLAAAYSLKGETERATAELAEARKLVRDGHYSSIARLKAVEYSEVPKVRALIEATYFAGLRKAGMPEE